MGPHVILDVALGAFVAPFALVHLLALVEGENVTLEGVCARVGPLAQVTLLLLLLLFSCSLRGSSGCHSR